MRMFVGGKLLASIANPGASLTAGVAPGLCGGRGGGGGGGEWGGRRQLSSPPAGSPAPLQDSPPGAVPLCVGGDAGLVPPSGQWGRTAGQSGGSARLPSLSPLAPAFTRHSRAGGRPWQVHTLPGLRRTALPVPNLPQTALNKPLLPLQLTEHEQTYCMANVYSDGYLWLH